MTFARVAACTLLLFSAQVASAAERLPLRWCYEDAPAPPWTRPDGTGLNIALLQQIEKKLGEHFVLTAKPWKRCLEEVRRGDMDGAFGAAYSEERRTYGVFPLWPDGLPDPTRSLHEDRFKVFVRKGSPASWDGKQLHAPGKGVLVQRGYVVADLLRAQGREVHEFTNSAQDALRRIALGVEDVAIIRGMESEYLLRSDARLAALISQHPVPYAVLPMHLFVGGTVYTRDPGRIDAIWTSIGSIRKSAAYRATEARAFRQLAQN
jgi:polar amino acid transport system substrate-binding protein